jgi:hypothetical protein
MGVSPQVPVDVKNGHHCPQGGRRQPDNIAATADETIDSGVCYSLPPESGGNFSQRQ